MAQYQKHHVSKHERDRQARLQWQLFVDSLITVLDRGTDARLIELSQTGEPVRVDAVDLDSGCYWRIPNKGAE